MWFTRHKKILIALFLLMGSAFGSDCYTAGFGCTNLDTQIKGSREPYSGVDSGTANAYVLTTTAPLGPGLKTLSRFYFLAVHANTTASTLNADGSGVKTIKKWSSGSLVDLASGDISATQAVEVIYDGTYYQMGSGPGGGGGGGGSTFTTMLSPDWCTGDQTTNSPYSTVLSLTNYSRASMMFITNAAASMYCQWHVPHNIAGTPAANIVITFAANDSTSGHTTNFKTCDIQVSTTVNVGALSCNANQTFTTTTTAYAPVTKTYAVQSTVTADGILAVAITAATTGTAPTNDIMVADIQMQVDQTL